MIDDDLKGAALACTTILAIIAIIYFMAPVSKPHTPEQKFVIAMQDKCLAAANSRGHYDQPAAKFECWRKPFMRHPKLIFTESYDASKYTEKK